jgi:predicted enzyme involved in methoxymalonyl-ACP biosynthesis
MKMQVQVATPTVQPRLYDLFTRANRTAAFAPEWEIQELNSYIINKEILVANVTDKFGDYGLVGAIIRRDSIIAGLAISCRLQGRGVGSALLGYAISKMILQIQASWIKTPYNDGVRSLYDWYNFSISEFGSLIVAKLETEHKKNLPEWIEIT